MCAEQKICWLSGALLHEGHCVKTSLQTPMALAFLGCDWPGSQGIGQIMLYASLVCAHAGSARERTWAAASGGQYLASFGAGVQLPEPPAVQEHPTPAVQPVCHQQPRCSACLSSTLHMVSSSLPTPIILHSPHSSPQKEMPPLRCFLDDKL